MRFVWSVAVEGRHDPRVMWCLCGHLAIILTPLAGDCGPGHIQCLCSLGGSQHGTLKSLVTVCVPCSSWETWVLPQVPLSSHWALPVLGYGSSMLMWLNPSQTARPWVISIFPTPKFPPLEWYLTSLHLLPFSVSLLLPVIHQDPIGRHFTSFCCLMDLTPTLWPSELSLTLTLSPWTVMTEWPLHTGCMEKGMKNSLM